MEKKNSSDMWAPPSPRWFAASMTVKRPAFCSLPSLSVFYWAPRQTLNNCICSPDPWESNKQLIKKRRIMFISVLGFLFIAMLAPEIQGPLLQLDECSQLRVICAAQETRNILQDGIFGKIWVCLCEHLPFLYRALKSNSKDR